MVTATPAQMDEPDRLSSSRRTGQFEIPNFDKDQGEAQGPPESHISPSKSSKASSPAYPRLEQVTLNDFAIGVNKDDEKASQSVKSRQSKRIKSNL
jgi:hypothetical protein